MSSNSVCNHSLDLKNWTHALRSSDFVNQLYNYRQSWTPLSPITITKYALCICTKYNDNNKKGGDRGS